MEQPLFALAVVAASAATWVVATVRAQRTVAEAPSTPAPLPAPSPRDDAHLWQRVFEFAPNGYILLELDGRLVRMNQAACDISGVRREDGEGRYIFELGLLDDEGLLQAATNLDRLGRGDDPGPAEYDFHRGDGTVRRVEVFGHLLMERTPPVMLTIVHDVTERRRAEDELRRYRVRLEEAQRVAGIVTWEMDLRSGSMWLSHDPTTEPGQDDRGLRLDLDDAMQFIHPDDRARVAQTMASQTLGAEVRDLATEYRQTTPQGERVARTVSRVERDAAGTAVRVLGATLDITDIRRAEQEIRELNAELEGRVRERTRSLERAISELEAFSYSVSHDLRAPLRTMAGYSEMVLEEARSMLSPGAREQLERIRASSIRMGQMIDDLLSLSRLTRAARRDGNVDMSALAAQALRELADAEPERVVAVNIPAGLTAVGDAGMLRLALQNLLANAWKFTRKADLARIEFGREQNGTYFVADNGVGFDRSLASKLFRPFERLHRVDEFEGTGIGLAIVDRVVRRHGGRIWADSTPGKGATFRFTLDPLSTSPEPERDGR